MTRLLAALLLAALLIPTTRADFEPEEHWYVVEIQGQRSGWMREAVAMKDGNIHSSMQMQLAFGRGAMQAEAGIETSFIETPDGEPVQMSMTQRLGAIPNSTTFVFTDSGVTMTADNAGQTFEQQLPLPQGEWLTPYQSYQQLSEKLDAGEEEITFRTVTPLTGVAPIETTMRVLGKENIEVLGRSVPAIRASVVTSMLPGVETIQHTSLSGRPLRTSQDFGAMKMVVIAADKQLALAELDPPEIMASTFVKPTGVAIKDPRNATRAVYKIKTSNGRIPPAFVGGAQTADEIGDGVVQVTVDLQRRDRAPFKTAHRVPSSMLAADDAVIKDLAKRSIVGIADDPEARALAMREFVYQFVSEKNLGVGYASASEVARTGEGDCTEHAVLLAAMLRAGGIPSRVMSGLVYTQAFAGARDVFGYHAWTQAHVNGRWIDLDPTLPNTAFDAAHIALGASAMSDGELVNALVDVAPVLGNLEIEVVSIK